MQELENIKNRHQELANNILKGFNNVEAPLQVLTKAEFDEKFASGHEVFSVEQLVKFNEDINKASKDDFNNEAEILEKGHAELGSLEKVIYSENEKNVTVFVRKK